jgi:hypothetical protein
MFTEQQLCCCRGVYTRHCTATAAVPFLLRVSAQQWVCAPQYFLVSLVFSIVACYVSATVNNCGFWIWSLNLLDFNSYNYSYSLHKFTTHNPETCLLVVYHFTSYLSCLPVSLLSVFVLIFCPLSSLNCSYLCLHLLLALLALLSVSDLFFLASS